MYIYILNADNLYVHEKEKKTNICKIFVKHEKIKKKNSKHLGKNINQKSNNEKLKILKK